MKRIMLSVVFAALSICNILADATAGNYRNLWDKANEAYTEALGSDTRELITNASQLSSNASDWQEGQNIEYLIDNNAYTFWHSDWHNQVTDPHYIQVDISSTPVEGDLIIYVLRRITEGNHVTQMGIYGSNDNEEWTFVSNVELKNALSGASYTSNPISLNGNIYKYLRFYILSNTSGRTFGHFAEFQIYEEKKYGDNYIIDMGEIATTLYRLLEEGKNISDADITTAMITELKKAYLAFVSKLIELKYLPNTLNDISQLRRGVTYSIRGRYDEGYLVYNPAVTSKWVSILGARNETYNTIANDAYREEPNLNDVKNVWQFVEFNEDWYLYNQEAKRFLYSDGTSAYQLSSTPVPVHVVQIEDGIFALNTVSGETTSKHFANIDLSKETKPLQRSTIDSQGAQFIIEKASPKTVVVDVESIMHSMRLPKSLAQLTNLPTIYINTFDSYNITSKDNYKYANLWRVNGEIIERYDSMKIRGRGNSTWNLAKKPYRIKFNEKEKFLGKSRANARNWTLMANHADKTLIRNAVASFIGTELGQAFTPAASFVDLYINDNYMGNYQVCDHVDIRKNRIDITEQEEYPTEDSDITGGYFMEVLPYASEPAWFSTSRGTNITIKSPESEVLSYAQQSYIANYVNEFENRLFSGKYKDEEEGYRPMVDSLSLASWFLATEFTGNADGYYSIYFYKDAQDDKLYFGPLWDFDIAFNNCDRIGEVTNRMMIDAGFDGGGRKWPIRMWKDPWFKNLTGRIWHKCVEGGMIERTLHYVDSLAEVIDKSQEMNFKIWPLSSHVYNEITLYSTYQEGVDYLKKFITEHAEYLSSVIPKEKQQTEDEDNKLKINDSYYYRIFNKGNSMTVDVTGDDNTKVCIWTASEDRKETQQWYLKHIEKGYYQILSRGSNLAITDMASENDGIYYRGSNLVLQEIEKSNDRQLWHPVMVDDKYMYFENKETELAWNNAGGSRNNGNGIISWTNDEDNVNRVTRLWTIEQADERLAQGIANNTTNDLEYRITYNPEAQEIHIRIPAGTTEIPNSKISVYDLSGKQMLEEGNIRESIDTSNLPRGVYLLRWTIGKRTRSIKFLKQ